MLWKGMSDEAIKSMRDAAVRLFNILLMTSEISYHILLRVVELFDICYKVCPSGPPREQYLTFTQCNRPLPHGSNHGEGA